jgi:predicted HD superfamily hydrolase involved in NAD metabolism
VLYTCARNILEQRLSDYRFLHSISVSQTAVVLAELYGVDEGEARIAGLVHDWDKNYSDEELIARAREFGVPVRDWEEDMAALLHAQTGAEALRREFPMFSEAIIQAVARHTSAASDMSPLDMVIYVADMIEPLRTQGNVGALRALVGKLPLEALFLKSYETTMKHLVTRHRFIHPDSLEVWNTYIHKERIGMKHTKKEHM